MQPQHQPASIERDPRNHERRQGDRYRVTVHMAGEPWFYETQKSNTDAMDYQRRMRDIYKLAGLPVFVHKERINPCTTS